MKNSYVTPDLKVFQVKADERFVAACEEGTDIANWDDPTLTCIVTRGDGPVGYFHSS